MTASAYKWWLVALCCGLGALNYADRAAIASVYPLVRRDLGLSDVELGAVGSCFLLAYAVASPLSGLVADRLSRRRLIVASLAGWSAVTLLTGWVASSRELLATRVLLGLCEAAYLPAAVGLIADYHPSRTRATAIGFHSASLSVGIIAGGAGFGYLGERFGWRFGFLALGALGLLLAVGAGRVLRDAPDPGDVPRAPARPRPVLADLRVLVRIPSYLILLATGMGIGIGHWIFLNWLPLYFNETYHLTLAGAGLAGTFMIQGAGIAAGLAGSVFSDRLAGRVPRRRLLIQGVAGLLAAPFLLVFFRTAPGLPALDACIFLFSFLLTFGACNVTPLTCDLLPARLRSTAVGLGNALNCLAGGAGVLLSGFLKGSIGLAGVFGGVSGVILVSAGLSLVGYVFFLPRDLARAALRAA